MTASPSTTQIPVAMVDMQYPFHLLTFYEEGATTTSAGRNLRFNTDGWEPAALTGSPNWTTLSLGSSVTVTSTAKDGNRKQIPNPTGGLYISTVVISFPTVTSGADAAGGKLEYWPLDTNGSPAASHATVSVQTQSAGTSTSNTPGPSSSNSSESSSSYSINTSQPGSAASTNTVATSSVSSSALSTSSSSAHSQGIRPAAAAGVGVGCLLAGALIAGMITWFCMKRRNPASGGRDSEASTVALMHREKGPMAKTTSISSGSRINSALENGLPLPLEDKAISGEISKISNLIKNHVQSYYHSRSVNPGMIDHDDLEALGDNIPVSVGTLSTLLHGLATREVALRFCIAWVITSRIRLDDASNTTFLPPEIARSIQSMNLNVDKGARVHSLFYVKWRALTSELLQSTYVRNAFSAGDGRTRNIQAALMLLDNVLRPFADSRMDDGTRSRNLEEILKRSAQFAFTLFSQPTAWDFDWQNGQGIESGNLCIFPALVQVEDANGMPIRPPRPFSEAVNRRLEE